MSATVKYRITEGTPPFTVSINPAVAPPQTRLSVGEYYFFNIPDGYYTITIIDSLGFDISFSFGVYCEITTTTTTTLPPTIECLEGLIIEAIYIHQEYELNGLPDNYEHPCTDSIGKHTCARALFEIFAVSEVSGVDNVCIGGLRLNNNGGYYPLNYVCPCSGYIICHDYENRSEDFDGVIWSSSTRSRYDKIVISQEQALAIAEATSNSTTIKLAFLGTSNLYGIYCSSSETQHEDVTWLRISTPTGEVIYNGCPKTEDVFEIDICDWRTTTSTTTGQPATTTTTTSSEIISTTTTTTSALETVFIHIPNL